MQSILEKASKAHIIEKPFPHLAIQNALDAELYEELIHEFPSIDMFRNGGNFSSKTGRYFYPAHNTLSNQQISPLWHKFIAYHLSQRFYRQVISLFGDYIRALHPDLESKLGKSLEDLESNIRFKEEFKHIALECQLVYSLPNSKPSIIIGPHLDRAVALYAGLLYFRLDDDDSTGGDFELYRFKSRHRFIEETRRVPERYVEKVKTVPYQKNTLVLFPHSPDSVHGVSVRSASRYPRLHVNFVGELEIPLYDLSQYYEVLSVSKS
jgi:hypothetical protein